MLVCGFESVQEIVPAYMEQAKKYLSDDAIQESLNAGQLLCKMGRGDQPALLFLQAIPSIVKATNEEIITEIVQFVYKKIGRTPNAKTAIAPFLKSLDSVAFVLQDAKLLREYFSLIEHQMNSTTISIHGIHDTHPSPSTPDFLEQAPFLVAKLSFKGIRTWIDYGLRNFADHPERQKEYFALTSPESRAIFQSEREGTLFVNVQRKLDLYQMALWETEYLYVPYSSSFELGENLKSYIDEDIIYLPDIYEDTSKGVNFYRGLIAHIIAHTRWTNAVFADNFSPFQRISIETFEDARVEYLAIQKYPGLRRLWQNLHPAPEEDACNDETQSCIRHRLAILSRALLDKNHNYKNPDILEFVERFHNIMQGENSTKDMVDLGLSFMAKTRLNSDFHPKVYFDETEIAYRDDNRKIWKFYELSDDEEFFDEPDKTEEDVEEVTGLPPKLYPEWDYSTETYKPDWVAVYEKLHTSANAAYIDQLLDKHKDLVKQIKRMIDLLKPQNKVRIRFQEEGDELDLDIAIRSLIDFKSGAVPDTRINMSHKHSDRNISVMLLLDLSESLNQLVAGSQQSILELSQEAVSLLSWAVEQLGDSFAIAGFNSNTRKEVHYHHIKGYSEHWGEEVKSRLAAMKAEYSTRMGAAMRHAAHYLEAQNSDKKLLLVLTDGEPADIDVKDEQSLITDTHQAVNELKQKGIYSYCINLDPAADNYVQDIFGNHYTIIDRIESLPMKLPQIFMSLTA
jgi:hypothetical protein